MSAAIELIRVRKSFGKKTVLDNLNLTVPEGSLFGLLGKNGQGKSTILRIISGLTSHDAGQVRVLGWDRAQHRLTILQHMGCLIDAPALYPNLTAHEFLRMTCHIKGLNPRDADRVLDRVKLLADPKLLIGRYSLGMKQRLALAHALLGDPRLLILDEPLNGLDPEGVQDIRSLFQSLTAQGITILLSSHQLDELARIASHVAILAQGCIVAESTMSSLLAQHTPLEAWFLQGIRNQEVSP